MLNNSLRTLENHFLNLHVHRKVFPWTDDTSPLTPNSVGENMDAFSDMVALKKVSSADVTHAISRKNWTSGTTYDEYDHTISATNTS